MTYGRSGVMRAGLVANTPTLAPLRNGQFPTPCAADGVRGADYHRMNRPKSGGDDLVTAIARTVPPGSGVLNPRWVEWLMGFPLNWTDLE